MCWGEARGAGHIPRWKLGRAQTDGLQSLDTTDRKLGGADSRSTQQQAQPWNRQPIPGNDIFYSIQAPATPDHSPMSLTPALILLLQQQLVHSSLQDDKVCCVARNALQQSWGQRLQVESRLVGL